MARCLATGSVFSQSISAVTTANTPSKRQGNVAAVRGVLCVAASGLLHQTLAITPTITTPVFAKSFVDPNGPASVEFQFIGWLTCY
jgi:hypothetical protein